MIDILIMMDESIAVSENLTDAFQFSQQKIVILNCTVKPLFSHYCELLHLHPRATKVADGVGLQFQVLC